MEANEIMVGVFVYFNCFDGSKIIVRVTGFKDGIVYGDSEMGSHWCNIEKVEPIHLTPEILEKNGFVYFHKNFASLSYEHPFKLEMVEWPDENGLGGLWTVCNIIKIQFVHELQHALRLCGIEKEIVL